MKKFTKLTAVAAPLDLINIDTDMIIPKQFLKTIKRSGLGKYAFNEMRYNADGTKKQDFILHNKNYCNAGILVAGDNFGCGSSREHAPWALEDLGIRCIISPSFADIFYANCFNNGICPIVLPEGEHREIMALVKNVETSEISVDLQTQQIIAGNKIYPFKMEEGLRQRLLKGLDHINITLKYEKDIDDFEERDKAKRPWL